MTDEHDTSETTNDITSASDENALSPSKKRIHDLQSSISGNLGSELLAVICRVNRLATHRIILPLPIAQARLLFTIGEVGQARISELAEADHCSQPTMTTQVRRLEKAGLVTRIADNSDGRAVLIEMSDKGVEVLTQIHQDRMAAMAPELERLTDEEQQILKKATTILNKFLLDNTLKSAK